MKYPITGDEVVQKLKRLAKAGYDTHHVVFGDAHGWNECEVCPKEPVNEFCSWRGSYSMPTCYYDGRICSRLTVTEMLDVLGKFFGSTQEGYKGGDFVMDSSDPLWADRYGSYAQKGVIDIIEKDGYVVFVRAQCEYLGGELKCESVITQ